MTVYSPQRLPQPGARTRTRLAIVDDHAAIADGLAALLAPNQDIEVVAVLTTRREAAQLLATDPPDVILCDIMLDGGEEDGLALLAEFHSRSRFLIYTAYDLPSYHRAAIRGGAFGFVSKVADRDRILAAIRAAATGHRSFDAATIRSARTAVRPPAPRQREVLELVAAGATNAEIARELTISVKAVEGALRRLFERCNVDNRTSLVRFAEEQGWVTSTSRRRRPQ